LTLLVCVDEGVEKASKAYATIRRDELPEKFRVFGCFGANDEDKKWENIATVATILPDATDYRKKDEVWQLGGSLT
jgi:hypothetical protein